MLDDLTGYDCLQRQYSVATASVKAHTHTHTTYDVLGWIRPGLKPIINSTKDLGGREAGTGDSDLSCTLGRAGVCDETKSVGA